MVALALKKMKMSLSVLIVAWGSISKVGIRSIVNNSGGSADFILPDNLTEWRKAIVKFSG